jgi:hypothetical protein
MKRLSRLRSHWPVGVRDPDERLVTVLEIPPVVLPETAVKMAIVAPAKGKK